MHALSTRRTSLLLLACTCASAWAQDTPPITVTLAYTADSDETRKAELGLLFHTIQGLQKFELDARLANYKYLNNPEQDHTETNYTAAWHWAITPRLRGNLNASRQETPKPDFIDDLNNQPNRQTHKSYRADAEYEVDGPWRVVAGVSRDESASQFLTASNRDSRSNSRDVGVRYDAATGSWLKLSLKSSDGSYLSAVSGADANYQQKEQDLRMHWAVSVASSLDMYLTQVSRTHEGNGQLDFDGRNYGVSANWAVSGRSTLVLGYDHALSVALVPLPVAGAGSAIVPFQYVTAQDSLSLGWNWQTSSRTQVRVRQAWQRLDYRTPANASYQGFQNSSRDSSVSLVWTPGTRWQISTLLQRQTRNADLGGPDNSHNLVSLTAQYSF